jgi:hypothetical protein
METKLKILNVLYPIHKVLNISNLKRNIKCPNIQFHNDKSPSSHIYGNIVWCFKCKQIFRVSDIITWNSLNINELFNELSLGYNSKEDMLKDYKENKVEFDIQEKKIIDKNDCNNFLDYTKKFFEG